MISENERRIQQKIAELKNCCGDFKRLDAGLGVKRLAWIATYQSSLSIGQATPRQSYEALILTYMRIDPTEAPIVVDEPDRITWASRNFCPLLEACNILRLDTRKVCRLGTEGSVQQFVSTLNPRLVFSRDYPNLRPFGEACVETISLR